MRMTNYGSADVERTLDLFGVEVAEQCADGPAAHGGLVAHGGAFAVGHFLEGQFSLNWRRGLRLQSA